MTNKILRAISWIFVVAGIAIIITLRVIGVDLTEGQLLIEYAPYWILTVGLLFGGAAMNTAERFDK